MSRDASSSYYDAGGIEVFEIIKAKLTPDQFEGFLLGNSIKYACRMMHKNNAPLRDAEKAANYTTWLRDAIRARANGEAVELGPAASDCTPIEEAT